MVFVSHEVNLVQKYLENFIRPLSSVEILRELEQTTQFPSFKVSFFAN